MSRATEQRAKYVRYSDALNAAHTAATMAQSGMVENMRALDCGFAWIVVHDAGFTRWCRDCAKVSGSKHYGSKHYAAGWCFWSPGAFNGQSIGIKEAGARAFRDSLAHALQIRCELGSRLD
jgi:hypothetical protein